MFWQFGFHSQSALDGILHKENFTLEELLDCDDIIEETKAQNKRLTDFLSKEDVVKSLLDYVIREPDPSVPERNQFKYSNMACEVLKAEAVSVMNSLTNKECLEYICTVLDRPAPLHPVVASFFSSIATLLFSKNSQVMSGGFYKIPGIVEKLIKHINTPAIMDFFFRLMTANIGSDTMTMQHFLGVEHNLIDVLINLFADSTSSEDVLCNVSLLLCDCISFARKQNIDKSKAQADPNPKASESDKENAFDFIFFPQLLSQERLGSLVDFTLSGRRHPLVYGMKIVLSLMKISPRGEGEPALSDVDNLRHLDEMSKAVNALTTRLNMLHDLLLIAPEDVRTGSGVIPPLGSIRLGVVNIISALISLNNTDVNDKLVELGSLKIIIGFFPLFPDNNFLHALIFEIVKDVCMTSLEGPPLPLFQFLFKDCQLLQMLVTAFQENVRTESPKHAKRKGFMAHLVKLVTLLEELQDSTPNNPFKEYEESSSFILSWTELSLAVGLENKKYQTVLGIIKGGDKIESGDEEDLTMDVASDAVSSAFARYILDATKAAANISGLPNDNDDDDNAFAPYYGADQGTGMSDDIFERSAMDGLYRQGTWQSPYVSASALGLNLSDDPDQWGHSGSSASLSDEEHAFSDDDPDSFRPLSTDATDDRFDVVFVQDDIVFEDATLATGSLVIASAPFEGSFPSSAVALPPAELEQPFDTATVSASTMSCMTLESESSTESDSLCKPLACSTPVESTVAVENITPDVATVVPTNIAVIEESGNSDA